MMEASKICQLYRILGTVPITSNGLMPTARLEPISYMLLKLPIMLLSSAPKSSLLCSKLCLEIQIMLIGTVKFNTLKLYRT